MHTTVEQYSPFLCKRRKQTSAYLHNFMTDLTQSPLSESTNAILYPKAIALFIPHLSSCTPLCDCGFMKATVGSLRDDSILCKLAPAGTWKTQSPLSLVVFPTKWPCRLLLSDLAEIKKGTWLSLFSRQKGKTRQWQINPHSTQVYSWKWKTWFWEFPMAGLKSQNLLTHPQVSRNFKISDVLFSKWKLVTTGWHIHWVWQGLGTERRWCWGLAGASWKALLAPGWDRCET